MSNSSSKISSVLKTIVLSVALLIGILHIANTAGFIVMSSMTLRMTHLMAMMIIVFLLPEKNKGSNTTKSLWIRVILMSIMIVCSLYGLFVMWPNVTATGGSASSTDAIVGLVLILVLLEATRRYLTPSLAIVAAVFLLYPFVCNYLPGVLHGRTYRFNRAFNLLFSSANGIYGMPLGVSSTFIVMFSMFGAFLSKFDTADFLFKFSSAVTRGFTGATAKTAVVFSLLIGMISGSPAGNAAIAGSIAIPLMKQRGYKKERAAAFEAVAATGGPLMPPVMGSSAFLMSEITGIRYAAIMKAALFPALLYYASIMSVVHYECKRTNTDCTYIPSPDDKTVFQIFKEGWHHVIPIAALIVALVWGLSPIKSAYYALIALVVVYVISSRLINMGLLKRIASAIQQGAINTSGMAVACATSGIVVGVLTMTGLGSRVSTIIISAAQGNVMLALFFVMLTAIVLGMGLPTAPAYLILSSVAVPALMEMGLPLLASHLFVFFFSCISAITPPVALASYVTASIADAELNKVGYLAFFYGIVSFILPYMFISSPAMLLDGAWYEVIQVVFMGLVGVTCLAMALVGYFKAPLGKIERFLLFVCGLLLIDVRLLTDVIGILLAATICYKNAKKSKDAVV